MSGAWDLRREMVKRSQDAMLHAAHVRREALGLIDMEEDAAQLRIRALDVLSASQLLALVAQPSQQREGQIRALTAAQRRRHHPLEVAVTALDDGTGMPLYRWSCPCGRAAVGDYHSAKDAREAALRHVARDAATLSQAEKPCQGCGQPMAADAGRYCSRDCREATTGVTLLPSE